ncbi:triphosphoribosyl-dephospho-CoA synthase [Aurantimonas coralicida]|uniref:triphosphoribosyl-dephospho-CoA synthase n=1 Tax=Aurantimonas coralicida TaxID=182270 RepID=UPI00238E49D9|nr:triphosphoribosyl-dephospho-CoA synthase [Aurantimonas coralicida]MDE0923244.1 triphosphoribosyl-dephospho-CoA synthase [Aurantimonas coralicida]
MSLAPDRIAAAFLAACRAELDAAKPGNVHRFAGGHGMHADTFEAAARATAPWIAQHDLGVGARILGATRASWEAVGLNANLGIVLLCAPLAAAAERHDTADGRDLREAVADVLARLDAQDAHDTFAAIALATPGGLGEAAEQDVRSPPTIGLVEAMRLAADRDLVARQYADGFCEIFEIGLPALTAPDTAAQTPGTGPALAAYLAFASVFPDSHLQRKYGPEVAETVRRQMADLADDLARTQDPDARLALALRLDGALKRDGRNPGTSADLTVASLFAQNLAEAQRE